MYIFVYSYNICLCIYLNVVMTYVYVCIYDICLCIYLYVVMTYVYVHIYGSGEENTLLTKQHNTTRQRSHAKEACTHSKINPQYGNNPISTLITSLFKYKKTQK
jgi:hypothetical protein